MNLKNRLEKLEGKEVSASLMNICLWGHSVDGDCAKAKAEAIAAFVAKRGHEPQDFIELVPMSSKDKKAACGCGETP